MSQFNSQSAAKRGFHLSLDTWAVIAALWAALLIRLGVVTRVPW